MTNQDELIKQMTWGVRQRLVFLESCILWNERLTTNMLIDAFNIGRRQAGKDIMAYQNLAPDNLQYDMVKRGYIADKKFKPVFLAGTAQEYCDWMLSTNLASASLLTIPSLCPPSALLRLPSPEIDLGILKAIVRGIREKKAVEITFSHNPLTTHIICPHALIFDGDRILVRGHENHTFKTIDLMDVTSAELSSQSSEIDGLSVGQGNRMVSCSYSDKGWQETVQISMTVNPNTNMNDEEREHIEHAYRMSAGVLTIEIRAALVDRYNAMVQRILDRNDIPLFVVKIV